MVPILIETLTLIFVFGFQVRPHLELTFENILSHINTVYVLRTKKGIMQFEATEEYSYLRLKVIENI